MAYNTHFGKNIILFILFVLLMLACKEKKAELELNENNQIYFFSEKNNDKSIRGNLFLTVENVKDVQQFIMMNYPAFDFEYWYEEFGNTKHKTDDFSIGSFVDNFNQDGPGNCAIYLSGIEEDAGYSSVLAWLNGYLDIDEPRLFSFHFYIDEEYSDCSGISFNDYEVGKTKNSDVIWLRRGKYRDTGNYFWQVEWPLNDTDDDDDIFRDSKKDERTAILTSFLKQLRSTKVFDNIDLEWFGMAYTGIDRYNQRIIDLLYELFFEE